jgi:N-acetylglucosamine kinase-like BadF-type ATPase
MILSVLAYPSRMRCVLGLDGGGTKTECVLMDEQGSVAARGRSGPSNPVRVGVNAAVAALEVAVRDVFAAANVAEGDVVAIVAGLAGAGRKEMAERMTEELRRAFPGCALKICTDLELALAAAGDGPAVVLVAGTGSAAIGRDAAGRVIRAGGLGPALGDEGSAYDIGRRAIAAAMQAQKQSSVDSRLARQILQRLRFSSWEELGARASANADEVYPRIFPIVAEEAGAGDALAQGLLREAAGALAKLAGTVAERLELSASSFFLAKTGGLIGRSRYFDEQLDVMLRREAPQARIGTLPTSPAEAAARLALQLARENRPAAGDS